MGTYINPGNGGFAEILSSGYVDKTLLIDLINRNVNKTSKLVCVSRPRRFGKSYAAKMLSAYYDSSCDSHSLFDDKKIASTDYYEKYLNKFNVITLEMTYFVSVTLQKGLPLKELPNVVEEKILRDLKNTGYTVSEDDSLIDSLTRIVESPDGRPFVFIIDEWDAPIREGKDDKEAQKAYLDLLRSWFKNVSFTPKVVAAAYMTGILPIKTDGSQSALSDFNEYTMIKPRLFASFVGFTEDEVRDLCEEKDVDFNTMKRWYNGYYLPGAGAVYNPNSVMKAIRNRDFDSYWVQTSASEALLEYISKGYNGLSRTIAELVGGIDVKVDTVGFANDLTTFRGKDDVLTLLIHLGYLAYNSETETVRIPNEEIKREFQRAIHTVKLEESVRRLEESERLFRNTLEMNEEAVALQIEKVHMEETVPIYYNSEQSLRSVIKLAYYTYRDHYLQFEELPAGSGYADVVYIPLPGSDWPPLVVELKWKRSAKGAIDQILENNYPACLKNYKGEILLVGINYDRDAPAGKKKHTSRIVGYNFS